MRRRLLAASLSVALAVTAACVPGSGADHGSVGSDQAPPPLAEVSPLDDPHDWEGPAHAGLGGVQIRPVTDAAAPQLPVTVTDAQGTEVTITDVDRVLALDIYGTLSQTVHELGLGDSLVGRDVSTQFDAASDLPLVTSNGHELNAESILALDPTLIITDTSLGPWDVVLQMRDAGIPVVVVDSTRSLENITTITSQVAAAMGVPDLGVQLGERIMAETQDVVDEIAAVAPGSPARPSRARSTTRSSQTLPRWRRLTRTLGCAPSSSTCAGRPGSTTCSARAPAPTTSSRRSACTTSPPRSAGPG